MDKKETYEEYKIRKGITNVHKAITILGLDAVSIISKELKEANRLIKLKSKYYTPKIEQFVVGFEYEIQDDKGDWLWSNTPQDKKLLERCIKDGRCRALANES
tara:strand:- start:2458 stop:2766 length:309 start_codon:yes stop_codon:yes gene_type:complete